ncbi:mitochondrial inner membrane protein protein [Babesia ovis]|uniref:Mitochondrial inner membrane protein protein n=1 Tax=Babesia ovis TaxID=5869 RepID=A0A9W5TC72_BABOV|nr:mitochondrial inner membrane protein protein [Babesia ovis]
MYTLELFYSLRRCLAHVKRVPGRQSARNLGASTIRDDSVTYIRGRYMTTTVEGSNTTRATDSNTTEITDTNVTGLSDSTLTAVDTLGLSGNTTGATDSNTAVDTPLMNDISVILELVEQHNGNTKSIIQRMLPVEFMRDALTTMHDATGLSWATTITALTISLKVGFVPLWALGERARRNNAHLVPIATELQEKMKEAQQSGDAKKVLEIQRAMFKLMARKTFIKGAALQILAAGTQGLTFAWVYGGLKMFAIEPRHSTEFIMEHPLWLDSLALPDPYYIFPVTLYLLMTSIYELNRITAEKMRKASGVVSNALKEQEERQNKMKYFTRASLAVFVLFSSNMTASTFFYLIPSFMFQAILRYTSQRGIVARLLRLPVPQIPKETTPEPKRLQRVKNI